MLHFWSSQHGSHSFLHCTFTMPPLPRSSPEGATTEWTVIAPADEAYYHSMHEVFWHCWFGELLPPSRRKWCFHFVCLFGNKITCRWMFNVHETFGRDRPFEKEQLTRFVGDLHSHLDTGLLPFFAYFQYVNCTTLQLFAGCQHCSANDFSDEPDFNITFQFNAANYFPLLLI